MKRKMLYGFTLVELIIVIVILAILAGLGTYGIISYMYYSEERECEEARSYAISAAELELRLDPGLASTLSLSGSDAFSYIEHGSEMKTTSCPSGGTYTAKLHKDGTGKYYFTVECSYHSAAKSNPASWQNVSDNVKQDIINSGKHSPQGSDLQRNFLNYLKNNYGYDTYPSFDIDGKTYYLKVNIPSYQGVTAEQKPRCSDTFIYLSSDNGNNWRGGYFYYEETDTWYSCSNARGNDIYLTGWSGILAGIDSGEYKPVEIDELM